MSAHLSYNDHIHVPASSGPVQIYSNGSGSSVRTIVVSPTGGGPTFVGWYDSTGNTCYACGAISAVGTSLVFGPMAANDQLIATASLGDNEIAVAEVY